MALYRVEFDYDATGPTELALKAGETLEVFVKDGDWWYGSLVATKKHGWFPRTYIQPCDLNDAAIELLRVAQYYTAKFNYEAKDQDELTMKAGSLVSVTEKSRDGWYFGTLLTFEVVGPAPYGWVPANYLRDASSSEQQAAFCQLARHYSIVNSPSKPGTVKKATLRTTIKQRNQQAKSNGANAFSQHEMISKIVKQGSTASVVSVGTTEFLDHVLTAQSHRINDQRATFSELSAADARVDVEKSKKLSKFFHLDDDEASSPPPSSAVKFVTLENEVLPMDGPSVVIALFNCVADDDDELSFKKGQIIILVQRDHDSDWWEGYLADDKNQTGLLPRSYVRDLDNDEMMQLEESRKKEEKHHNNNNDDDDAEALIGELRDLDAVLSEALAQSVIMDANQNIRIEDIPPMPIQEQSVKVHVPMRPAPPPPGLSSPTPPPRSFSQGQRTEKTSSFRNKSHTMAKGAHAATPLSNSNGQTQQRRTAPKPARVLYSYTSTGPHDIALTVNQIVTVVQLRPDGWSFVRSAGLEGLFPTSYLETIEKTKL